MLELKRWKHVVEEVMRELPKTRDSNWILYEYVLLKLGWESESLSVQNWMNLVIDGTIPDPESVSRYRRMLENPPYNLKGKYYDERHGIQVKKAQEQLNYHVDHKQQEMFRK